MVRPANQMTAQNASSTRIMAALMSEWGIGHEQAADAMAVFFREEAA